MVQPSSSKCFPNQVGTPVLTPFHNSNHATSTNPVPVSLGRSPLTATLVIRWVRLPNLSKYGVASPLPWKLVG